MKDTSQNSQSRIAEHRRAFHDYFIEERYEAGIELQGWEVKSIRAGRVQIDQSYVVLRNGEAWLLGSQMTPLSTAAVHIQADPQRTRRLLLKAKELSRLIGQVERRGYTLVPLHLYWKRNLVKLEIGLAKGKKQHDKRESEKIRDADRDVQKAAKIRFKSGE